MLRDFRVSLLLFMGIMVSSCFFNVAKTYNFQIPVNIEDSYSVKPVWGSGALFSFIGNEKTDLVTVKSPSGHFYEYDMTTAVREIMGNYIERKFGGLEMTRDPQVEIEIVAFEEEVMPLDYQVREYIYKVGMTLRCRIIWRDEKIERNIIRRNDITVEPDLAGVKSIQSGVHDFLIDFIREIDSEVGSMVQPEDEMVFPTDLKR